MASHLAGDHSRTVQSLAKQGRQREEGSADPLVAKSSCIKLEGSFKP